MASAAPRPAQPDRQASAPDPKVYLDDPRFNQSFTIPPGPHRKEPLHVTYSDFGYRNPDHPEREHVLLFCGPLLSTRFLHAAKDEVAKKHRIRVIYPDRPGIGGTTKADAQFRLETWLEIVPALLRHLNVSHVSVACHSAGTLYALHMLLHLRHLLNPKRPYVALCTPWILPTHSGVQTMKLTTALPTVVMRQFGGLARLIQSTVGPVADFSGDLVRSLSASFGSSQEQQEPVMPGADRDMVAFEVALMESVVDHAYAESIQGMSEELPLLFKKCGAGQLQDADAWAPWGDIDKYVPMLAEAEKARVGSTTPSLNEPDQRIPLEVEVFFSEKDHMIGTSSGPEWFRQCWGPENRGDHIRFQSHIVDGAEHDNILGLRFGVMEKIFQSISGINQAE